MKKNKLIKWEENISKLLGMYFTYRPELSI